MNNINAFFFVPASKMDKIFKIKNDVDEIIIDFEDGIKTDDREKLQIEINKFQGFKNFWYRVPVRNDFSDEELNFELLNSFLDLGIRKVVLPKIISKNELILIYSELKKFSDLELILLIEHPRLLLEMPQILQVRSLEASITGIGIGSHDFMAFMEVPHSSENLKFLRQEISIVAKAYGKIAIDIASMEIKDQKIFEEELASGYSLGLKDKFIIHPQQIFWLHAYKENNLEQLWAEKILASLPTNYDGEPFIFEGEIIERPHVKKAIKIINKQR